MARWRKTSMGGMAGFTLFEMLVALSLLSLLVIILSGQFRFGLRAWEAGAAMTDELAELQAVQMFLRRQLAAAQPLADTARTGKGRHRPIFSGERRRLRLAAGGLPRLGPAPYNIIDLSHERRGGEGRLMVHWRPHYPATKSAEAAKGQERPLLAGIGAVKFSYFGTVASKDRDAPARWHDEWTDQRHLPKLIRIELDFDDADRYWPELTVALPIRR